MFQGVDKEISKLEMRVHVSSMYGPVAGFFNFFQGRSTAFAIFFAVQGCIMMGAGVWGFINGRDLTSLAALIQAMAVLNGSIQAILFAHSVKEDWAVLRQQAHDAANPPVPPTAS